MDRRDVEALFAQSILTDHERKGCCLWASGGSLLITTMPIEDLTILRCFSYDPEARFLLTSGRTRKQVSAQEGNTFRLLQGEVSTGLTHAIALRHPGRLSPRRLR